MRISSQALMHQVRIHDTAKEHLREVSSPESLGE